MLLLVMSYLKSLQKFACTWGEGIFAVGRWREYTFLSLWINEICMVDLWASQQAVRKNLGQPPWPMTLKSYNQMFLARLYVKFGTTSTKNGHYCSKEHLTKALSNSYIYSMTFI